MSTELANGMQLKLHFLELLSGLKGFSHQYAGKRVALIQAHQGRPATGGRRAYLCIHAVERNVFKLEDGLALYVNCINEGGQLYPESFASKYRGRPEGSLTVRGQRIATARHRRNTRPKTDSFNQMKVGFGGRRLNLASAERCHGSCSGRRHQGSVVTFRRIFSRPYPIAGPKRNADLPGLTPCEA